MRIAIACSGLSHINRGIESWAADMGRALQRHGADVTLFQGSGLAAEPWQIVVPCRRRFDPAVQRWTKVLGRLGGWRYGCGSGYQIEQTSFSLRLWPRIRSRYDILHVQDPWIAYLFERWHRLGLSQPQVVLAHGTEEGTEFLSKFQNLQHLAPCYLEDWEAHRPAWQKSFAVPNFVDVDAFHPGDRGAAREAWDLPQDHLIVLCVAAIKRHHKRVDYLIEEFAEFAKRYSKPATLVVAGGREAQTDEVIAYGKELLGDQVRFLVGVDRSRMPDLLRAADIFVLASLHEMMPIAVLEALASGLPIVVNDTPTLRWMAGPAGRLNNLSERGALAEKLSELSDSQLRAALAKNARSQAENLFSESVVIEQLLRMYSDVAASDKPVGRVKMSSADRETAV